MNERRKARELALQILFQKEFSKTEDLAELIKLFQSHFSIDQKMIDFTRALLTAINHHVEEIDKLIQKHSHNWSIDRLSLIDVNLLRICICEILFLKESPTPPKVAVNECLEIAKKYSSQDSPQFLNGLLDQVVKSEGLLE